MKRKRQQGQKRTIVSVVIAVAAALLLFLVFHYDFGNRSTDTPPPAPPTDTADDDVDTETAWVTYTNAEYGFSMDHPADWEVHEFLDESEPKFNFVPETTAVPRPLTHHSEAESHVSIFPQGVPTEGFFGETAETDIDFIPSVERPRDYVLADGTPFATVANLSSTNEHWREWGFIFAHVVVENSNTVCMRGDEVMSETICDPLTGDTLVRSGSIDPAIRAVQVRMLESFRFLE